MRTTSSTVVSLFPRRRLLRGVVAAGFVLALAGLSACGAGGAGGGGDDGGGGTPSAITIQTSTLPTAGHNTASSGAPNCFGHRWLRLHPVPTCRGGPAGRHATTPRARGPRGPVADGAGPRVPLPGDGGTVPGGGPPGRGPAPGRGTWPPGRPAGLASRGPWWAGSGADSARRVRRRCGRRRRVGRGTARGPARPPRRGSVRPAAARSR